MKNTELEELYKQKNYSKIKELLKNSNESWSFNILANICLQEGDFNGAYNYYNLAKNTQGCGYCKFITGEIEQAKIILSLVKDSSSFVNWILFLTELCEGKTGITPTYFQIRNFYEQDLEMLFTAKQYEIIKKIINKNSYLENFNKEIYKYTARVLLNNNMPQEAEKYLKKSIDICYKDPETHFLLGEIFEKSNYTQKAIQEFKKAIEVTGEYLPAEKRLKYLLK